MQTDTYIRLSRYAKRYDVAPKTVRKWADAGLVTVLKVGRCWRVLDTPPASTSARAAA